MLAGRVVHWLMTSPPPRLYWPGWQPEHTVDAKGRKVPALQVVSLKKKEKKQKKEEEKITREHKRQGQDDIPH